MVFKGCPRCGGDMFLEEDLGYRDLVCLQCSYRKTVDSDLLNNYRERQRRYARWLEERRAEKVPA
jgi:hypothetical protein